MTEAAKTYVLLDGENIDMTLGTSILKGRPRPDERPRWDRVRQWVETNWGGPVKALFFLNANHGLPVGFIAALHAMDFVPIPLTGRDDQKVVDLAILRTLEALAKREGDVILGSHDADFADAMSLLAGEDRRLGVLGFPEFMSGDLRNLEDIDIIDLEDDVGAFDFILPRTRVIPIDTFDPEAYL